MSLVTQFDTQTSPAPAKSAGSNRPDKWLVIESETLGDALLYIRDPEFLEEAKSAHPDIVAYADDEVDTLYPHREQADILQHIHAIKKKFGGKVRPNVDGAA